MTALLATTQRIRVGSMVLAAGFRHPALMAHMAGALQEISGGRLLLGLGAGNQIAEHTAFGLAFDRRVGRFEEYLQILTGLLKGESVTLQGKHYQLENASLLAPMPRVPIVIAAGGERMTRLTARYADGWNAAGAGGLDGEVFRQKLGALRANVEAEGRDPDQFEITYSATVMVARDAAETERFVDTLASLPPGVPRDQVRDRFVVGTPDEVAAILRRPLEWGANHLICGIGAQPFSIWSAEMVELFAKEVIPRLRSAQ
jgi:alkanesulfonate monooxygenase SsuD/methylene tetrahydromethanopterin reductase-like flavin-dependent oxidoreductase (luciferase family)